jgi:hypothetical protein
VAEKNEWLQKHIELQLGTVTSDTAQTILFKRIGHIDDYKTLAYRHPRKNVPPKPQAVIFARHGSIKRL